MGHPPFGVPPEPQGAEGLDSSSWVGIDGALGSDDVLQAGVEQRVDPNGQSAYNGAGQIYFANDTTGQHFTITLTRLQGLIQARSSAAVGTVRRPSPTPAAGP